MKKQSVCARILSGFLMFSFLLVSSCSHRLLNSRNPAGATTQPTTQPNAGPPLPLDLVGDIQNFSTDVGGKDGKSGMLKTAGDSIMAAANKKGVRKYLTDGDVQALFKRSRDVKMRVQAVIADANYGDDAKFVLLQAYVAKVVSPQRELVTLLWTDADTSQRSRNPVNDLMFPVSRTLIPKKSMLEDALSVSMNGVGASGVMLKDMPGRTDVANLAIDPLTGLQMDVQALAHAQTKDNYVRAMKLLTIHMILTQQQFYNVLSGSSAPLSVPQGCREKLSAGLPDQIDIPEITPEERQSVIDNFLSSNGIVGTTAQYRDHFLNNVRADPTTGGFSGYALFDRYTAAQYGLDEKRPEAMEPGFDDVADYEIVMGLKAANILGKLKERPAEVFGVVSTNADILRQLVRIEDQNWVRGEGDDENTIQTAGMSSLVVNLMKSRNVTNWQELVPEDLQNQLKANVLQLEMPPLDGPDTWTRWGLFEMSNVLKGFHNTGNPDILNLVKNSCPQTYNGKPAGFADPKACMNELWGILYPFQSEGDEQLLPRTSYESPRLRAIYPQLRKLWNSFRDQRMIPAARVSEWDYLSYQVGSNPWASVRLGYLLAKGQSADIGKPGLIGTRPDLLADMAEALHLNEPLYPFWGNRILTKKEKKIAWEQAVADVDAQNALLFRTANSAATNGTDTYKRLAQLSHMTVLSPATAQQAVKTLGLPVTDTIQKKWNAVWARPDSAPAQKLLEIYNAKGDVTKQEALYTQFADQYGWDTEYDAKAAMYDLDTGLKAPVYESVLNRAATIRKVELAQPLNELCKMNLNGDLNNYKALYFRTVKAQDEVNQAFGLKAVPKDVMKEAEKWSKQDWNNLWLGLAQGILWIGVSVFSAGCTVVSAGFCLPIALALASAAMATQLYMFKTTTDAALDDAQKASAIKIYAELGLTTDEAASKIQQHHYWEIALEAAFTFPLIGAVAKTGELTTRAAVTGVRRLALRLGGTAVEDLPAIKGVVREAEIGVSRYVLGITSKAEAASFLGHYARMFLLDPASKKVWAKISRAVFREEVVRETPREINHYFAHAVADFFGNNPKQMLNLVGRYTGRKLNRLAAKEIKLGVKLAEDESNLNALQRFWRGTITRMRYNRINTKVVALSKLKNMKPELEELMKSGKPLTDFAEQHADELSEIIHDMPTLYREFPYMATLMGGPLIFEKNPIMRQIAGSVALKRMVSARDNMLYQTVLNEALDHLGVKQALTIHNTFDVFDAFRRSVTNLPDAKAVPQLNELMDGLAASMSRYQIEKLGGSITKEGVLRIFASTADADREASKILWETTPSQYLFSAGGFKGSASEVLKQFANYNDVDEFQAFLNALKIVMLSKKQVVPASVGG